MKANFFFGVISALAHLLRFFAHLVLVLRQLDQPLPEYAANKILEAYVKVLEANDQVRSLPLPFSSYNIG